jgi:glycosyltransferase involved in cell wall biosynthesis
MHFLIIADSFPPSKNSSAVQISHLAEEFFNQGHEVTLFIPTSDIKKTFEVKKLNYAEVIYIRVPFLKSSKNITRAVAEILMPFLMISTIKRQDLFNFHTDGVVWYSPSIFHGKLVKYLNKKKAAKNYLIIRDIFPEWALDLKVMKKNIIYYFFRLVANYQYSQADVIGVQSPGNLKYFKSNPAASNSDIEVLDNWLLDEIKNKKCSISIDNSILKGRKIFVYAGNMGIAQGMDILIDLAISLNHNTNIGFVFVGRGASMKAMQKKSKKFDLSNILFYDEIDPNEIPSLYDQCSVGLISLDLRHQSHNIPGKFLSYMQSGLPVLASVNPGNDLINIVNTKKVGFILSDGSSLNLSNNANKLVAILDEENDLKYNCKEVFKSSYSAGKAVQQIVKAFI